MQGTSTHLSHGVICLTKMDWYIILKVVRILRRLYIGSA